MKRISEGAVREESRRGKNEPMAKTPVVAPQQNGEAEPTRAAARRQPGTDESRRSFERSVEKRPRDSRQIDGQTGQSVHTSDGSR